MIIWQWYVSDPEEGISLYDSEDEARKAAEGVLSQLTDECGDGWPEDMEALHWGRLVPSQIATAINERPAPEGSGLDLLCEYEFRAPPSE